MRLAPRNPYGRSVKSLTFALVGWTGLAAAAERYDHRGALGLTVAAGGEFSSFGGASDRFTETLRAPLELGSTVSMTDHSELRLSGRVALGPGAPAWSAYFGLRNSFGYEQLKTFFDLDFAAHVFAGWALGARAGVGVQYDFLPIMGAYALVGGQLGGGSALRLSFEAMVGLQFRTYLFE
jgi:hypothetical protein